MRSVTRRWLVNFLSIIVVVLTVIMLLLVAGVRSFYYSTAQDNLKNQLQLLVQTARSNNEQDPETLVTGFEKKTTYEIMLLDKEGNIVLTSSGFKPQGEYPDQDYRRAVRASDGYGTYEGRTDAARSVTSVCYVGNSFGSDYGGIRIVSDMSGIDTEIVKIALIFLLFAAVVILFVVLSSSYFIKSIVNPIAQVGVIATKIASGDFSVRLTTRHNDEIGQLCNIINFMADELQKAETVKNEFISQVSHELRTPLTAIKGWGDTILACDPVEDRQSIERGVGIIIGETERLSSMVEELLDFSRMQSGRLTLVLSRMDVVAELEDVLIMFGERAKREGIAVNFQETGFVSPVFGDKNRLRQVFVNILDNALKYSEEGGSIDIHAREVDDYAVITIADTGLGIPQEDLPNIKEKFVKGANSRRGTGIGLAVSDEIITLHKGELSVTSKEGIGTEVRITVPVMDKKVDSSTMQIAKIDEEEIRKYNESKQRNGEQNSDPGTL